MRFFTGMVGIIALLWASHGWAFTPFKIEEIQLEGLKRISSSTVFNYLNVKQGDTLNSEKASQVIHDLFETGFFSDIRLESDKNTLILMFEERPSISKIEIEGNEEIQDEDLTEGLKKVGLAEGRVFNRSLLEKVRQELQRQYFALGKYGVRIETKISDQSRNRVSIKLIIDEGAVARIRKINIIGNEAFSDKELQKTFSSELFSEYNFLAGDSQYNKQRLSADLENMRSYYLDRGYINFTINSTQVSITPDKRDVYITANVTEGGKYSVETVSLAGDLIVKEEELQKLISITEKDTFSRKAITESSNRIGERLGEEGYAFANVNAIPDVNEENKSVKLTFFVDPGKRVYVRQVKFVGNTKTHDEVMRREMRQMEGGWISNTKLNRSKIRLQRTGFFEDVNIETPSVPGKTDQVDVIYTVKERPSGSITASLGYGQGSGLILAGSVNQNNFLGTGNRVSAEINTNEVSTVYSFAFTDPYYTINGVSRGFRLFSRETSTGSSITRISEYNADVYGAGVTYGFPLSEFRTARLGFAYENTSLTIEDTAPPQFLGFKQQFGDEFGTYKLDASWNYDSRNRVVFADHGTNITISTEAALPYSNLTYFKTSYLHQWYISITDKLTLHLKGEASYGRGYGETDVLPFYENYFAGGGLSVRGFRDNSLGPKDAGQRAIGGNRKVIGTTEFLFPSPLAPDSRSVRISLFVDGGNVYGAGEPSDWKKIRATYGASFIWITPVGALRFSWAWPLRTLPDDQTQRFQFSIGAPF
ncbi:MAG: outer membrane protein assembly factor BamA [Gammaproteobacteria bacterium]|nr:outer membrane protein assembly factor BamA [Gammaproteobacteria bacterium]MDH5694141.1 outer membrane protein assembly factor BamA [Gammaproteobacteria bacterium]